MGGLYFCIDNHWVHVTSVIFITRRLPVVQMITLVYQKLTGNLASTVPCLESC